VNLVAGHTYTLSGVVQKLSWATPSQVSSDISQAAALARKASTAVVVVGDGQESEGADRANLELPAAQDQLISAVSAANKHTVVVVDAGGPVLMPWLDHVSSVLDAWYPGQSDGNALAGVLFGTTDPSGHLPMTFPASTSENPVSTSAQFPGTNGKVHYSEGVEVGYRWYDATGTKPLFPFGFGLSYTTFSYGSPSVHVRYDDGRPVVTASVQVQNTGNRSGADVAQLYLGQPSSAGNPPRQLESFQRVTLNPGESRNVVFTLRGLQLAFYNQAVQSWQIAKGKYRIWMGDSSALAQLPAKVSFAISRTVSVTP
jgi:beta-glucosidase